MPPFSMVMASRSPPMRAMWRIQVTGMPRKRRMAYQDAMGGLVGVLIEIGALAALALAALLVALLVSWII